VTLLAVGGAALIGGAVVAILGVRERRRAHASLSARGAEPVVAF
jgi:hypothetical protein